MQRHHLLIWVDREQFAMARVNPKWDPDTLLAKDGVFFLEDLCGILPLRPERIRGDAKSLEMKGQCPWQALGVRCLWGHWLWVVQMTRFAPYVRTRFNP